MRWDIGHLTAAQVRELGDRLGRLRVPAIDEPRAAWEEWERHTAEAIRAVEQGGQDQPADPLPTA